MAVSSDIFQRWAYGFLEIFNYLPTDWIAQLEIGDMNLTCCKTFNCIKLKLNQQHAHCFTVSNKKLAEHCTKLPGAIARSDARLPGMHGRWFDPHLRQHSFLEIGHEIFFQPFSPFRWFKKGSYQLLAKECALSTCKLPRRLAQEQCG